MARRIAALTTLLSLSVFAGPPVGEKPKSVTLQKNEGGRVTGEAWSSDELKGRVFVIFYVDPDLADLNNAATEALKAEKFTPDVYQSLAIINMAATWLPNFAIDGKLKEKQKAYPDTIYVRDIHKLLVLGDPRNRARTIIVDERVAGFVASWPQDGARLIAYWVARELWGRGVATSALTTFVEQVDAVRPLEACVATSNVGSIRVLEKCGFALVEGSRAAGADGVEEVLYRLS